MAFPRWPKFGAYPTLLLAPLIAVPAYRIGLIGQDQTADPWLYTAYGRILKELVATNGWTYYSIRFPAIAPISLFSTVFRSPFDFIVLRYVIFLLCTLPFFVMVRRVYGSTVAVVSLTAFLCVPWFTRIIAWDLTTFVAVPACLSGIALWLTPSPHRPLFKACAGFAFAAAICSHQFAGAVLLCFFVSELATSILFHRARRFVFDCVAASFGVAVCVALGVIYYNAAVGPVGLRELLSVSLGQIAVGMDYHDNAMIPAREVAFSASIVFLAPIMVVISGFVLAREVFNYTVGSRIFWFSVVLCAFCFLFHFALRKNILGYMHYSCYMFPAFALLVPVVLSQIKWRYTDASVVMFAITISMLPLLLFVTPSYKQIYQWRGDPLFIAPTVAAFVLCLLWMALLKRSKHIGWVVGVGLAVAVQVPAFSDVTVGGNFNQRNNYQFAIYRVADALSDVIKRYDRPGGRLLIWYPKGDLTTFSMGFLNLGNTVQPPFSFNETGMPEIGEYERRRLFEPGSKHVLLLSQDPDVVERGVVAIRLNEALVWREEMRSTFGSAPYQISAVVLSKSM